MSAVARPPIRLRTGRSARRAVLTLHIVASVGLLGDSAGFLAVAIRGASTSDPGLAEASWKTLEMFSVAFGIPLSFIALGTGILLGLSSKWGVLRYPWVVLKLGLLISVILVGALVHGPGIDSAIDGGGAEARLIAGSAWDVIALATATGLSVFKPGRARRAAPA